MHAVKNNSVRSGQPHNDASQDIRGHSTIDTFQHFLIAEHMKPCMHILEISISSLNHFVVRPTKTPKSADKKC